MKRFFFSGLLGLILISMTFNTSAQVKQVEMHIDGYLCGN